ncbi:MAG: hypothetical protein WBO24_06265 [Nitrospirales bacterium]
MTKEQEIKNMIYGLYRQLGLDPEELKFIKPNDGVWGNALSYDIQRKDGAVARIYRKDIDDSATVPILAALRRFRLSMPNKGA